MHALVFIWLGWRLSSLPAKEPAGLVTVDLIEAVSHPPSDAPAPPKPEVAPKPKLLRHQPQQAKSPQPSVASSTPAISQNNSVASQKPTTGSGNPGNALGTYVSLVMHAVTANKRFPAQSLAREEHGRVVVGVTVARDGTTSGSAVETSSRFSSLDEAALSAVNSVGRFPAVPPEIPAPIHLHIPIEFQIQRRL